jgi:hypothetical protein
MRRRSDGARRRGLARGAIQPTQRAGEHVASARAARRFPSTAEVPWSATVVGLRDLGQATRHRARRTRGCAAILACRRSGGRQGVRIGRARPFLPALISLSITMGADGLPLISAFLRRPAIRQARTPRPSRGGTPCTHLHARTLRSDREPIVRREIPLRWGRCRRTTRCSRRSPPLMDDASTRSADS